MQQPSSPGCSFKEKTLLFKRLIHLKVKKRSMNLSTSLVESGVNSPLVEKRCYIFVTKKVSPVTSVRDLFARTIVRAKKTSGFSTKVEFSRVFPTLDNTLSSREWRQGSGLLHPLGGATIYYARDEDS